MVRESTVCFSDAVSVNHKNIIGTARDQAAGEGSVGGGSRMLVTVGEGGCSRSGRVSQVRCMFFRQARAGELL